MSRAIAIATGLAWFFVCACQAALAEHDDPQERAVSIESRQKAGAAADHDASSTALNIRVNSNLVLIPVSVTDMRNRLVAGLQREHFQLFDDQVEQAITHFASEDARISVAVVFDSRGSMGPKLQKAREAVAQILGTANPNDEFAVIQFNQRVQFLAGSPARWKRSSTACRSFSREDRRHCWMQSTWPWTQ
jgi:hypothetical protein